MTGRSILDSHRALEIHRAMEVRREEYLDHMTFKAVGRPMFTEIFGPLVGLKEEWKAQGATPEELDLSAFRYRRAMSYGVRVNTGWMGGPQPEILGETYDFIIGLDRYGRRVKLIKSSATLPLPMDHPVKTMDDWLRVKPHYAFSEGRFAPGWKEDALRARAEGYVISVSIPGGFDEPRQLLGEATLCEGYYLQPEMIHDMLETIGDTAVQVLARVCAEVPVDQLSVHEDMAGKSGPLAGPGRSSSLSNPTTAGSGTCFRRTGRGSSRRTPTAT